MSVSGTLVRPGIELAGADRHGWRDGIMCQRYEFKYAIRPELLEPIRSFIRPYCAMDEFAAREPDGFYTITSLYLDSDRFRTYWDKEEEVPRRFKLRVRTYRHDGEGPVKFEVKHRFNEVSRKTWVEVPPESWPTLLTAPDSGRESDRTKSEIPALEDFIRLTRTLGARPKMLVRYERQAFASKIDRYVRVSFDRHLRYQATAAYDLKGEATRWRSNGDAASMDEFGPRIILELKFMSTAPFWLVDLVRTFGLMRRGFSKYCSAVSQTMHAGQTGRDLALAVPTIGVVRRRR